MAFWGLEVKSGKPTPLNLERRLVIKQAALSISKSSSEPVVLSVRSPPKTLDGRAHTAAALLASHHIDSSPLLRR